MMEDPFDNVSKIIGEVSSNIKDRLRKSRLVFGALGNDDNPSNYFQNITTNKSSNRWFETVGEQLETAHCMNASTRKQYNYGSYFELSMGNLTILNIATAACWHLVVMLHVQVPGASFPAKNCGPMSNLMRSRKPDLIVAFLRTNFIREAMRKEVGK